MSSESAEIYTEEHSSIVSLNFGVFGLSQAQFCRKTEQPHCTHQWSRSKTPRGTGHKTSRLRESKKLASLKSQERQASLFEKRDMYYTYSII